MVVQKLNNSVNIQLTYLQACKLAGIGKKLLSRKDQEDHGDKIEDRSVKTSINLGNDASELNSWRKQRKKSAQKLKEPVQLNLFNRFSFWEDDDEDASGDASEDFDGSDEFHCPQKTMNKKWSVVEGRSKKQRVICPKKDMHFETTNRFYVVQNLTEEDVENIIHGKNSIKSEGDRRKCNSCKSRGVQSKWQTV